MKQLKYIFLTFGILIFFACKKERNYHVHGILINEVTGNSHNMGGETIQLYSSGGAGLFSSRNSTSFEATTDNEGHFDFGNHQMKEGKYRINYLQSKGKTYYGVSNAVKEITLDKKTEYSETISIIPTMEALSFIANPLNTTSANDTVFVQFVSETRWMQDPTYYIFGHLTGNQLVNSPYRTFGGINNSEFMGRIFIKITKSYGGVRSIIQDTVFVEKDEWYRYYTPF